jgi:hypothetical protein
MIDFLETLKLRNELLYYFGWACLFGTLFCISMILGSKTQLLGINAWYKPMKFFLSTAIFVWTIAWLMAYLQEEQQVMWYSWVVILVFAFEDMYILYQASKGELSHFNISSPYKATMFSAMAFAISALTVHTLYIGILFFKKDFPDLSESYVWGIRLGIILFVIFAFEGFAMGARLSHTVGASDGSEGLPITNWSKQHGDLRIAHFLGMHALQIIPLFAYYVSKSTKMTIFAAILYFIVTTGLLIQALNGKPFWKPFG